MWRKFVDCDHFCRHHWLSFACIILCILKKIRFLYDRLVNNLKLNYNCIYKVNESFLLENVTVMTSRKLWNSCKYHYQNLLKEFQTKTLILTAQKKKQTWSLSVYLMFSGYSWAFTEELFKILLLFVSIKGINKTSRNILFK